MARFRNIRTDYYTHPKTATLSPVERVIHMQGILAGGLIGCWEASLPKIARTVNTDLEAVGAAIVSLEGRGLTHYFHAEETLWVIEAADEQCGTSPKLWKHVRIRMSELPSSISSKFCQRYPLDGSQFSSIDGKGNGLRGGVGYSGSDPPAPAPDPDPDPDPDPERGRARAGGAPAAIADELPAVAKMRARQRLTAIVAPHVAADRTLEQIVGAALERMDDGTDLETLEAHLRSADWSNPRAVFETLWLKNWRPKPQLEESYL